MNRDYNDIKSRLGQPLWYDEYAVPRYDKFSPDQCGIYDHQVALLEIRCQSCGELFRAASTWNRLDCLWNDRAPVIAPLPSHDGWTSFHYGDPPSHSCTGDTMNSEPVRVVEFWQRIDFEWQRNKAEEIVWSDYE